MPARVRQVVILTTIVTAFAATPVAAQGRGNAYGRGRSNPSPTSNPRSPSPAPSSASSPSPSTPISTSTPIDDAVAIRQFGAWLDDASVFPPGHGWASLSLGYSRSLGARQFDFPVMEGGMGLSRRAQFGATLPYYRLHFTDGSGLGGFGDVYLNVKYSLLDPQTSGTKIGLAVAPLVEVLSESDPATGGRFSWAVPVSVEFRGPDYRLYGSAGYFARGAIFSSGAVEVPLTDRLIVTGALIQMRSLNDNIAADTLGLSKTRLDVAGAAAYFVTRSLTAFGSIGRTLSSADPLNTAFVLNGGISISFTGLSP